MVNITFPPPPRQYSSEQQVMMQDALRRALLPVVDTQSAIPFLLMRTPGGKVYRVSIKDDGVWESQLVSG